MLILLLLFFVSTCAATTTVAPNVTASNETASNETASNETAILEKVMTGNEMITYGMVVDDLKNDGNTTGLNLDQVCLRGYVKAISIPTNSTMRLYKKSKPVSLSFTLCTPQDPVCMSRRDTVALIKPKYRTEYYRFGCRKAIYWAQCNWTKTNRNAIFCGTNIRKQLMDGTSINSYFKNLTDISEINDRRIRYVSMSEKKRRDLYSDYGDVHDYVETEERSYNKLYALLTILFVVGGYKAYTVFMKLLHYKKRNTQVDMDAPDPYDTEEDYKTSNSSSTDSKIHH